ASLIASFREEERKRRQEWQRVLQPLEPPIKKPPSGIAELPQEARSFVENTLLGLLTFEEKKRLEGAEGKPFLFARTLLEVMDRHPTTLPTAPDKESRRFGDLPNSVLRLLPKGMGDKERARLRRHQDRWPEFPLAVTEYIRAKHPNAVGQVPELGPCRPQD